MTRKSRFHGFALPVILLALIAAIGAALPPDLAAQEEAAVKGCCVCNDLTCTSDVNDNACTGTGQCNGHLGTLCFVEAQACLDPCALNCPAIPTATATNTVPTSTRTQTATNTVPTSTPTQTSTNTVPTSTRTQTSTRTVPTITPTATVTNTVPTSTPTQTATNTVPTGTPTPECTSNTECDDGVACTDDTCDAGHCQNVPNNTKCDDGNACTSDTCDAVKGCINTFEDADGDAVCDAHDPHPSVFDPTGCLYDEATGQVVHGGLVTVSGPDPGRIKIGLNGSSGCYQFSVVGLPADPNVELYTLAITLPAGCTRSTACLEDPNAPLDPTGQADPLELGPFNVAGYINPRDCGSNPFYLSFELSDGDPTILNNNIPLQCAVGPVPAPAMSPWALVVVVLLLLVSAFVTLHVRRNER